MSFDESSSRGRRNGFKERDRQDTIESSGIGADIAEIMRNAEGRPDPNAAEPAVWQWMHKSGWRNYQPEVSRRIERAYLAGDPYCRLKSGKMGVTPLEIFFKEMIQHDPASGNSRKIQRAAGIPFHTRAWRRWQECRRVFETGNPHREMFENRQKKRAEMLATIDHPHRSVSFYKKDPGESYCSFVASSNAFGVFSMLLVLTNAIWIGVDAEFNTAETMSDADAIYQVAEHTYTILFLLELFVRFGAYQTLWVTWRDRWLMFDLALVCLMIMEAWLLPIVQHIAGDSTGDELAGLSVLRIARVLRLFRLARVARLMRLVPEVMTLMKGITAAMKSVFFTLVLLFCLIYIFSVFFVNQAWDNEVLDSYFPTVGEAMWNLLVHGVFLDMVADVLNDVSDESYAIALVYVLFIAASSFTVMNLLIGILCDVVHRVTVEEKDQSDVNYLRGSLLDLLELHDKDEDRYVHKEEFDLLMKNPEIHMTLMRFGVDVNDLIALKDVLFEDRTLRTSIDRISFGTFTELVLRLRGGNRASVRDIVDLREYIQQRFDNLEYRADMLDRQRGSFTPLHGGFSFSTIGDSDARTEMEALKTQVQIFCAELKGGSRALREELDGIKGTVRYLQGRIQDAEDAHPGVRCMRGRNRPAAAYEDAR